VGGNHIQWAPLPHPHKSIQPNAVKACMMLLDHE
jgi:hypothetical protein